MTADETCECCEPAMPETFEVTPVAADEPLPADCPLNTEPKITAKQKERLRKAKLAHERELDRKAEVLSGILRRMTPREHRRLTRALIAKNRIEVARA